MKPWTHTNHGRPRLSENLQSVSNRIGMLVKKVQPYPWTYVGGGGGPWLDSTHTHKVHGHLWKLKCKFTGVKFLEKEVHGWRSEQVCHVCVCVHAHLYIIRILIMMDDIWTEWNPPLKEKLPQAFMQIEWMENDFRNLTAKVWANLDNPIKSYNLSKFWLTSCMPPSQVAQCQYLWCHNCLMELHTNFTKFLLFMKMNLPSILLYLGMLGLKWLCMHLRLNLINWTIDIQ